MRLSKTAPNWPLAPSCREASCFPRLRSQIAGPRVGYKILPDHPTERRSVAPRPNLSALARGYGPTVCQGCAASGRPPVRCLPLTARDRSLPTDIFAQITDATLALEVRLHGGEGAPLASDFTASLLTGRTSTRSRMRSISMRFVCWPQAHVDGSLPQRTSHAGRSHQSYPPPRWTKSQPAPTWNLACPAAYQNTCFQRSPPAPAGPKVLQDSPKKWGR